MFKKCLAVLVTLIMSFSVCTSFIGCSDKKNMVDNGWTGPVVPPPNEDEEEEPPVILPPEEDEEEEPPVILPPEEDEEEVLIPVPFYTGQRPNGRFLTDVPAPGSVANLPLPRMECGVTAPLKLPTVVNNDAAIAALSSGVFAYDAFGNALTVTVETIDGEPLSSKPLSVDTTHTATLTACDMFGRAATLNRTFSVVAKAVIELDNTAFTVFGKTVVVEPNKTFDAMDGVTVNDSMGELTAADVRVDGTVDTTKVGFYTLTYTLTDRFGQISTAAREVAVNTAELAVYEILERKLASSTFTATRKAVLMNYYQPFKQYCFYTPILTTTTYGNQNMVVESYLANPNESRISSTGRKVAYDFATQEMNYYTADTVSVSPAISTNSGAAFFGDQYDANKMDWNGTFEAGNWVDATAPSSIDELNTFMLKRVTAQSYRHLLYDVSTETVTAARLTFDEYGSGTLEFDLNETAANSYRAALASLYGYGIDAFKNPTVTIRFDSQYRITEISGFEYMNTLLKANPDTKKGESRLKYRENFVYTEAQDSTAPSAKARTRSARSESGSTIEADATAPVVVETAKLTIPTALDTETYWKWLYAGISAENGTLSAVGIRRAEEITYTVINTFDDLADALTAGKYAVCFLVETEQGTTLYERTYDVSDRVGDVAGSYVFDTAETAPVFTTEGDLLFSACEDLETLSKLLGKGVTCSDAFYLYSISDGIDTWYLDNGFACDLLKDGDYSVKYFAMNAAQNYTIFERAFTVANAPNLLLDFSGYAESELYPMGSRTAVIITPEAASTPLMELVLRGMVVVDYDGTPIRQESITVTGDIDYESANKIYTLTVTAVNANGISSSINRYFYLKDFARPTVTLDHSAYASGVHTELKTVGTTQIVVMKPTAILSEINFMLGVSVTDEYDGVVPVDAVTVDTSTIDLSKPNTYFYVDYSYTNTKGKTGKATRVFMLRHPTIDELGSDIAVYNRIADTMAQETYFMKGLGRTTATMTDLTIYSTIDYRPGEVYMENLSSGSKVFGNETSYGKRVYLKQNGDDWNGSFAAIQGESETSKVINKEQKYATNAWPSANREDMSHAQFIDRFGRPITQLFAYNVNANTIQSPTNLSVSKNDSGYYTMDIKIRVDVSEAVDGYKKQVNTISTQTVKSFNYATISVMFDNDYRLIQAKVDEQYVVTLMSTKTTNVVTYNYFYDKNIPNFTVRTF